MNNLTQIVRKSLFVGKNCGPIATSNGNGVEVGVGVIVGVKVAVGVQVGVGGVAPAIRGMLLVSFTVRTELAATQTDAPFTQQS